MHLVRPAAVLLWLAPLAAQTASYAVFTNLNLAVQPPDRFAAVMAFDAARSRIVLGGGLPPGGGTARQDTWEYDGTVWQQRATSGLDYGKPVRLVYSPQRSQVLALTGEQTNGGQPMRIFGWNGSAWALVAGSGPQSRATNFAAAWDDQRGVLVMFGSAVGAETWEWNGTVWAQRGTGGPVPRDGHRMMYDAARQVVVLFGGVSLTNQMLTDTWEWNGTYWLERYGIAAPGTSQRGAFGYDNIRQRCILYGGLLGSSEAGGLFEFDGAGWQARTTQGAPTTMTEAAMAFDSVRGNFVVFGGYVGATSHRTRTISFVTGHVAGFVPHGAGCAGPAGVPTLAAVGSSRPMLGTTFQARFAALPNSPLSLVFGVIGFQDQSWNSLPLPVDLSVYGLPGCSLRIEPMTTVVLSNNGGVADWNIAVPLTPQLDGQPFFLQGAVLTPGWNQAGVVVSESRRGVTGRL